MSLASSTAILLEEKCLSIFSGPNSNKVKGKIEEEHGYFQEDWTVLTRMILGSEEKRKKKQVE